MIHRALFLVLFATSLISAQQTMTVTWLEMPVHGLAAVLKTPGGKFIVIDAGGVRDKPDYNAGRDAIAPYLKSQGCAEIAAVVISHPHGDHYGGAAWLMQNMKVNEFIDHNYEGRGQTLAYKRLRGMAAEYGGRHRVAAFGDRLEWDPALEVEVLSPPRAFLDSNSDPAKVSDHGLLNSNSLVLRVQHGKNVFIFPGDSYGGTFERHMKASVPPERLKATVLTANHHGFNPGFDFPKMVMPQYVVASCVTDYPSNANTPYPRSPGDHAMKTYGALGAEVYVTAFHGNITAVSDGEIIRMTKQRARPAAQ